MTNPVHLLQPFSNLFIVMTLLVVVTGLTMLAPRLGQLLLRAPVSEERDEAAFDAFKVVFGMAGVVLSFSLVQANNNVHAIETLVGREGSAFSAVDRGLLRFGSAEAASIRPLLAEYGKGRTEVEWPALAQGERSPATDLLYNNLSRRARALQPGDARQQGMFAELLRNLDELAETRELVIAASDTGLPGIFWIMSGGLLLIGMTMAGLTDLSAQRALTLGAAAAAVSLLLSFVIIMDRPFVGEQSVSPAGIEKILVLNSRRI